MRTICKKLVLPFRALMVLIFIVLNTAVINAQNYFPLDTHYGIDLSPFTSILSDIDFEYTSTFITVELDTVNVIRIPVFVVPEGEPGDFIGNYTSVLGDSINLKNLNYSFYSLDRVIQVDTTGFYDSYIEFESDRVIYYNIGDGKEEFPRTETHFVFSEEQVTNYPRGSETDFMVAVTSLYNRIYSIYEDETGLFTLPDKIRYLMNDEYNQFFGQLLDAPRMTIDGFYDFYDIHSNNSFETFFQMEPALIIVSDLSLGFRWYSLTALTDKQYMLEKHYVSSPGVRRLGDYIITMHSIERRFIEYNGNPDTILDSTYTQADNLFRYPMYLFDYLAVNGYDGLDLTNPDTGAARLLELSLVFNGLDLALQNERE